LRPPSPQFGGSTVAAPIVPLDQPAWRLPTRSEGNDFMVAVAAGSAVWEWRESVDPPTKSGWRSLGQLPASASPPGPIDGLVYLSGSPSLLAGLQDGKLFLRSLADDAPWAAIDTKDGTTTVKLASIVPVSVDTGQLETSTVEGLVGIDGLGRLYTIDTNHVSLDADQKTLVVPKGVGDCTAQTGTAQIKKWSADVRPAAMKNKAGEVTIVGVDSSLHVLGAIKIGGTSTDQALLDPNDTVVLSSMVPPPRGGSLEVAVDGNELMALAAVRHGSSAHLATWTPFANGVGASLFTTDLPGSIDPGMPTLIADAVVVAGQQGRALVAPFSAQKRYELTGTIGGGVVVPVSSLALATGDVVSLGVGGLTEFGTVNGSGTASKNEIFYPLHPDFPDGKVTSEPRFYPVSTRGLRGIPIGTDQMQLDVNDPAIDSVSTLLIDDNGYSEHKVRHVDKTSQPWIVTLHPSPPTNPTYWLQLSIAGRAVPSVTLNASPAIDADVLSRRGLDFLTAPASTATPADPRHQTATPFTIGGGNQPLFVVLGQHWVHDATGNALVLDATVGDWSLQLGQAVSNPELSWEYWNGAWSRLILQHDYTGNLRNTGSVTFDVPDDIAPTDWAGKTHFWVRARLVGGDYGTETVEVVTKDLGNNTTKQSFKRSTEGFTAPSVMNLAIAYQLANDVLPTYVLAEDSGTTRDQSDANATGGALVEAFVPLSVSLGRLLAGDAAATAANGQCPPECDCGSATPSAGGTDGAAGVSQSLPVTPATGRSFFLGFAAPLARDTVKVLLMIARAVSREAVASLAVQALVGRRFVPVTPQDATRALGESGVLTLAFSDPPTEATLFGPDPLRWIRLVPTGVVNDQWSPSLRGAYLNAVWASATETLTRELLGSSEGEPNLTVTLARPPVLRGSLELRVREPLNDEERQALLAAYPNRVLVDPNLPGDWVLWDQVVDPADEDPKRRAYALDEASGEIRFGDGAHGKIPPVGRDSIVAFRYQRTEPPVPGAVDVPANAVEARAALNLVTPIAGAEAAFAADHAAGGAPAESDERVLRFGMAKLRHRGRTLTTQDLEDIALGSSPDIVQTRAVVRGGRTRLVVVMRGDDPTPSVAQMRELKRLLLAAAPASFDPAALAVVAPTLRRLRVALRLRVESLDHAAGVDDEVARRLADLLDPATGGVSHEGWPLGTSPRADEIAFALVDVPRLLGIATIELAEVRADATAPWPAQLAAGELARLAADGIRVEFEQIERAA
jgi:hypothetical protein